jgi:hypothetical protein
MQVKRLNSDQLLQLIIKEDMHSRRSRLRRARFVENLFGRGYRQLFFGGPVSVDALVEAQLCYIYGQFIGCVLLSQAFFEQFLGGAYEFIGRTDIADAGLAVLSREALNEGEITRAEFNALKKLRRRRNPYTHHQESRVFMMDAIHRSRGRRSWTYFESLYEEDARLALRTVAGFLLRPRGETELHP